MANQLLGQGASVSRGAAAFDSGGVHFTTGAALVDGTSIPLATLNADSAQWGTPVYGLGSYPVSHYALRLPKIGIYTGATTAPTNPTFHGAGDGQCTSTVYCEAMYDLSVRRRSRSPSSGRSPRPISPTACWSARATRRSSTRARRSRPGARRDGAAEVRQRRRHLHRLRGGRHDERPQRGDHAAQHVDHQRAQHPGLDVRRRLLDGDPGRLGLRHRRLDLPLGERRPDVQPGDDGRQRDDDPGPDRGRDVRAVRRLRRAGLRHLDDRSVATATATATRSTRTRRSRRRTRARRSRAGRRSSTSRSAPGHAILIGFDPWYRMWTMQEERLVLNGVLYPAGTAIPAS